MAKTLLNCVNETLKKVGVIAGDAFALSSLSDSSRQRAIDLSIQVINEAIDELYIHMREPKPKQQAQSTITLVTATRSYSLASNLVELIFPLIDKTNNQYILQYPGGYNQILIDDPEQDDTGLPHYGAISPVNGYLHLDRAPESADNGKIYTYQYKKDFVLNVAADTVPFNDMVFRAMVPVFAELWKREMRGIKDFDGPMYKSNMARAARLLPGVPAKNNWSPRG